MWSHNQIRRKVFLCTEDMHVKSDCSRTFFVCETKESKRGIAKPLLLLNITDKSYVSMGLMYCITTRESFSLTIFQQKLCAFNQPFRIRCQICEWITLISQTGLQKGLQLFVIQIDSFGQFTESFAALIILGYFIRHGWGENTHVIFL